MLTPGVQQRENLQITNASGIHAQPIAEHVFGLILMFARQLHRAVRLQGESTWDSSALRDNVSTLAGATLGIVGLGAIGARVAQIAAAFGMRVTALKRTPGAAPGVERLLSDHPLWAMENVILTPHYSGSHPGYVQRASAIFLENLARFAAGSELVNRVNKHAGY